MNLSDWDRQIASLPEPHILQTSAWAQVKSKFGWQPQYLSWSGTAGQERLQIGLAEADPQAAWRAAALVLERSIPIAGFAARLRVLYAPKGPLMDWGDAALRRQVLADLRSYAARRGAIFIKIDPDVCLGRGIPGELDAQEAAPGVAVMDELKKTGWRYSSDQIQFRNTVMLDLQADEESMLARMKQKTRYNIRLAARKGVTIRPGAAVDFPLLYRMYAETSLRDGFVIRDESYYLHNWHTFFQAGWLHPLLAEVEGETVAAVMIYRFAGKAWYIFGMSRETQREKMPNYLLQWEAMRQARLAGCYSYDLWGAPDEFNETDSMWGVYRFKEGLGGQVVRHIGAWDLPTQPLMYRLYTQILPRLLDVMRRRGKQRTATGLGA